MARLVEFLSNWIGNIDKSNLCPFAKRAWDNDKCKVVMVEDFTLDNFWSTVSEECMTYDYSKYDAVFVAALTDDEIINLMQLSGSCDSMNSFLNSQNKDLWLLKQHGDPYTLVIIQKITDLDDASRVMEKHGYYNRYLPYMFNKSIIRRRKMRERLTGAIK